MFPFLTDGFSQQKSYIVKTMLDDAQGNGGFVNTLNIFPKEKMMYETIIPNFELLYEEAGLSVKFAPKCHWAEDIKGTYLPGAGRSANEKIPQYQSPQGFRYGPYATCAGKIS